MRKIPYYLIVIILYLPTIFNGQTIQKEDSLLLQIEKVASAQKLDLTKKFAHQFNKKAPQKVIAIIEECLQLPQLTQLDSADFYFLLSKAYYYSNNLKGHTKSINAATNIINEYVGPKNEYYHFLKYQDNSLNAKHKYHSGNPKDALGLYLDALDNAELSKNKEIKANVLREIGAFYIDQKEYESALKYLNSSKAIQLDQSFDQKELSIKLYAELSEVYLKVNNLDSASKYLDLIPPEKYSPSILFTIASYHTKKDAPEDANVFLDAIISKTQGQGGIKHWLPFAQMRKGDNLYQLEKFEDAATLWLAAKVQFEEINDKKNLTKISNRLYNYYNKKGDSKQALAYFELANKLKDSSKSDDYSVALRGIEDSHKLKKRESENKALKEKESINETIIQRHRLAGLLGVLCIEILLTLVFVYFRSSATRKQLNSQLEEVNNNLTQKNKEVKVIADELKFITDNFPEGVARFNDNFLITYSNDNFKNCLKAKPEYPSTNIFQLLGFSQEDLKRLKQDLSKQENISFNWTCSDSEKAYQVQTVNIGFKKKEPEYLMVMEDVTQLKQSENLRFLETQQKIKSLENTHEKNTYEKQALNESLASKKKELATKMMQISKRNADLESIQSELKNIYANSNNTTKLKLTKVISKLNNVINIEDGWETFNVYFQEIHPHFLSELMSREGGLTNNEIRHCTYIKLGLNNKEVADMLHVAPKTVEVARYRIKKKLNLSKDDSLSQFIATLQ